MKSILISIRPEWVEKIANGIKSIEVRKTAPKAWADYLSGKSFGKPTPIDVYIYCTKAKNKRKFTKIIPPFVARKMEEAAKTLEENGCPKPYRMIVGRHCFSDGKVVAKFRMKNCLKLHHDLFAYGRWARASIVKASRLTDEELENYANGKDFYAWAISDLEIFDEPIPLAALGAESAPQSWAYIESDREPIYARKGRCEAYCDGKLIGGNYILHITMNGSEIMHQKWAVMPTKADAEKILSALNPEGI